MNELILKDDLMTRYQEVIVRRDTLKRDAAQTQYEYIHRFGDLIEEAFRLQIECISLKKSISYCLKMQNQGLGIDPAEMKKHVDAAMKPYHERLKQLLDTLGDKGKIVSLQEQQKVKAIYRRIARKIHPDVNPALFEHKDVQELWARVTKAYHVSDLKSLEEAEVLLSELLKKYDGEITLVLVPNIEEKIAEVEAECKQILTTEPYTLRFLLEDEEDCEETKNSYKEQIEGLKIYREELTAQLHEFVGDLKREGE